MEATIHDYMIEPFPWLLMAVYRGDAKHNITVNAASGGGASIPEMRSTFSTPPSSGEWSSRGSESGTSETTSNPLAPDGASDDASDDSSSIMRGMTPGDGSLSDSTQTNFAF